MSGSAEASPDAGGTRVYRVPAVRLIDRALPLAAINRRCAQETQGKLSPLHLWWSRKPAAACRAALLGQLLPAPRDPEALAALTDLVGRAAAASDPDDPALVEARAAVAAAVGDRPPTVFDPFSGSGAVAIEAQRLGLAAVAGDLNPVAVVIGKAAIEIPPRCANQAAVHPGAHGPAAGPLHGLQADVAHYGAWIDAEARRRLANLYPRASGLGVLAWIWCRSTRCPNPACGRVAPLVHTFDLCRRPGRETWLLPADDDGFTIGTGADRPAPAPTISGRGARCLHCDAAIPLAQLRAQAADRGLGLQLLAVVAKDRRNRRYLPPNDEQRAAAAARTGAEWEPDTPLPTRALGFNCQNYGVTTHRDLYTARQRGALAVFTDLVAEARSRVEADALLAGRSADGVPLRDGGQGARAWAEAVSVYLALAVDRVAARWCTFARWHRTRENIEHPFGRPGLAMAWEFAEANPFSPGVGSWDDALAAVLQAMAALPAAAHPVPPGYALQLDAADPPPIARDVVVCTDPPYFDNLPYADMADLFYVWLRRALAPVYPDLFRTMLCPKTEELVADPYRFGGRPQARAHFLRGMRSTCERLRTLADPRFPLVLFYAWRPSRSGMADGWEAMLEALRAARLQLTGTWPVRTEHAGRLRSLASNTLAASVLLVCRPLPETAAAVPHRVLIREGRERLPQALDALQAAGLDAVDLAQAAIGPGMALYAQYAEVLRPDGQVMDVRDALEWINGEVEAWLGRGAEAGGDDPETRFCLAWFDAHGFEPGPFAEAELLAQAKNTAVARLAAAGLAEARGGKVRLLQPSGPVGPAAGTWLALHAFTAALATRGRSGAERPADPGRARALALHLQAACERQGQAAAARRYAAAAEALAEPSPTAGDDPTA